MVVVKNFQVVSYKLNIVDLSSGNHVQKMDH